MDNYFPDSIGLQTVAYTAVASIAALLFDFTITFDSEASYFQRPCLKLTRRQVRWTWGRRWGITRVIFVVSRYFPFVGLAMTVYYSVESTRGGIPDHGMFTAMNDAIRWLGIAAAEFLLVTRTYVIWGCDKRFLAWILVFTTTILAAVLVISDVDASESGNLTGVFEEGHYASIAYGLLMLVELVLMSLTLYKRFKSHELDGSPLVTTLYRDGVIYMLCITLVSMANGVSIALLPSSYTALLAGPQLVMHSVLASRILFNLRAISDLRDVVPNELVVLGVISRPIAFQTTSCTGHTELWDITDG